MCNRLRGEGWGDGERLTALLRSFRTQVNGHSRNKSWVKKLQIVFAILLERVRVAFLLDSLSLSRHGESSVEHSSVMILDPAFGNSLEKERLVWDSRTSQQ
jgi:hypothetical protein